MVFAGKSAGVLLGNTILMVLDAISARSPGDLAEMASKTIEIVFPGRTPADLLAKTICYDSEPRAFAHCAYKGPMQGRTPQKPKNGTFAQCFKN